ncbi:MAG: diaminopimelate decarboxylase, partial [Christensenellales bacterium]
MKRPVFTLEQLKEIAEEYPTPFHLYDERGIRENARRLHEAFAWNEGFKQYFAVKATPNPDIIRILHEEGCGVDCSSMTELRLAEVLDITGDEIMFSSNATPDEEFALARRLGAIINLDDITHIGALEKNGGLPDTVCCRYNPGGEFRIDNMIMGNPGEAKFGFTREQLTEGYRILMQKGVKRFGLHAFLASNATDSEYYPRLAALLFETAVKLREETGAEIAFVNLSGGIGVPYRPKEPGPDIFRIGRGVKEAYDEIIRPSGMHPLSIYTELGRFMLAPYGYLVARAIREKHTHKNYIGLDASAANLLRPAMYGAYHHITVMGKEDAPNDHVYDVTGSLCESNDRFAVDRPLPRIDIGDLVVIHDTGAHGFAMGYNYNGKLRSAEVLLTEDGGTRLIRRAETERDYFAT